MISFITLSSRLDHTFLILGGIAIPSGLISARSAYNTIHGVINSNTQLDSDSFFLFPCSPTHRYFTAFTTPMITKITCSGTLFGSNLRMSDGIHHTKFSLSLSPLSLSLSLFFLSPQFNEIRHRNK